MRPIVPSGLYVFIRTRLRTADPGQIPHAFNKTLQSFPTVDSNCALAPPHMQKGLKSCNAAVSLENKQGKCTLGLCGLFAELSVCAGSV